MEFSITSFVLGAVVLLFATLGLIVGSMLVFNVTISRFAKLDLRELAILIFFAIVLLAGIAMVIDVTAR